MHIELGQGAKWQLVYQFTQSGAFAEQYINRYSQVGLLLRLQIWLVLLIGEWIALMALDIGSCIPYACAHLHVVKIASYMPTARLTEAISQQPIMQKAGI